MPFIAFTALKLFMNQYAVYYTGPCPHPTHVFSARVGISKVFFCGQLAVSIIEEQWDQSVVLGIRARTRLPEKFTSKWCILSAFLGFNKSNWTFL